MGWRDADAAGAGVARARIASTRRVTSTKGEYLLPPIVKVA